MRLWNHGTLERWEFVTIVLWEHQTLGPWDHGADEVLDNVTLGPGLSRLTLCNPV
jgi:hypothetical protein